MFKGTCITEISTIKSLKFYVKKSQVLCKVMLEKFYITKAFCIVKIV